MSLYPKVMHDDEVRAISSALYGKPDVDALWTPEVKEFLGSSSYDAVLYLNNAEGPGKHLSLAWIRNRFAKHGVVAKHTPGGQDHDQSTHGRRGGASRPPSTPSSTPSTPYRNSNFLDTLTEADPATFYAGFAQARAGKFGAYLSPFTEADFAQPNISAFVAFDGLVGGVLTDHGDGRIEVGSLFSLPGAPSGAGIDMLRYLIREKGANWLNNFDGRLTDFYKAEGFVEESRDSWNDEYAPSGWNYELFGRPDYVTMGLPNRIAKALLRALKWN